MLGIQNNLFWLVPSTAIIALGFAWFFFKQMMKHSEGTVKMAEIAAHVRKGAMAYLKQQYKIVIIVFVVLTALFALIAYVWKVQYPCLTVALHTTPGSS
ncbi:MAG: sodium/proton-translocating pyrophosphatase, partial [Candidatus Marinimicrobia bacterium]|nr:sodium/proton-translocating pyrophosphatase [Candidatus Neomarinimicrobiota bacterium]